jgi:hypothetical protein
MITDVIAAAVRAASASVPRWRPALRKPRAHGKHSRVGRVAVHAATRATRRTVRKARATLVSPYDTETMRLLTEWAEPIQMASILRRTAEMALAGPAGRHAALLVLCELRDAVAADRLNADLRRAGISCGPVGVV